MPLPFRPLPGLTLPPLKGNCAHPPLVSKVWGVDRKVGAQHFEFNRDQNPDLSGQGQPQPGLLYQKLDHIHAPGIAYFIDARTPHTVQAKSMDAVTLYIRAGGRTADTTVLSPAAQPDWHGLNAEEEDLDPGARAALWKTIRERCRSSGAIPCEPLVRDQVVDRA